MGRSPGHELTECEVGPTLMEESRRCQKVLSSDVDADEKSLGDVGRSPVAMPTMAERSSMSPSEPNSCLALRIPTYSVNKNLLGKYNQSNTHTRFLNCQGTMSSGLGEGADTRERK